MNIARRDLLAAGLGATVLRPALASPGGSPAEATTRDEDWDLHNVRPSEVEGLGWPDAEGAFRRLPERAEALVRGPVWQLSRDTAGVHFEFESDAARLRFEVELTRDELAMPHMPATGKSGVDLYARNASGDWRWVFAGQPRKVSYACGLSGLDGAKRSYRLYFPLYNGVEALRVGVPKGATFRRMAPRTERPLVYYGTSIAQGGCASRPGMAFVNQLGRRLDLPVLNLGFSGNGRMELELADLCGELDARAFVIDCLPNLGPDGVAERAQPFVRRLRSLRPRTPIVLVEDRTNTNAAFLPARAEHHRENHARLRAAMDALVAEGIEGLTYVPDAPFLGADGEGTVDGSHPTDLGMTRYADALEPVLRAVLES